MHVNVSSRALASLIPVGMLLVSGAAACRTGIMRGERHASATLFDATGRQVGVVALTDAGSGVAILGTFQSLPAGQHGIHFHAVGRCDAAGAFASAGAHVNPASRKHGLENSEGPHAGDLPNFEVGATGIATFRELTSRVSLGEGPASLLDADASAVVVHATADDQRTDPAGNSGARIACGVIRER
ncbi:MAG: superoxide dismutase family protein [Gemmatimonadaceae bacterium]